jgi:hypothetical protein
MEGWFIGIIVASGVIGWSLSGEHTAILKQLLELLQKVEDLEERLKDIQRSIEDHNSDSD